MTLDLQPADALDLQPVAEEPAKLDLQPAVTISHTAFPGMVSTTAGAPQKNWKSGADLITEARNEPTPDWSGAVASALFPESETGDSLIGLDPSQVPAGQSPAGRVGRSVEKTALGLGQFMTSPKGIVQTVTSLTPARLLVMAGWAHDMAAGGGQAAGNLSTLITKPDKTPAEWQQISDDTVNTVVSLAAAGKLGSDIGADATGVRSPVTRFLEPKTARLSKDLAAEINKAPLTMPLDLQPSALVQAAPLDLQPANDEPPAAVQTPGSGEPPVPPPEPITAEVPPAAASPAPKLVPVDVSAKDVTAMKTSDERPPDILDTIGDHFPNGVKFADDQNEAVRQSQGRASELMFTAKGEPADQVLQQLHANGDFKNIETPDDLAEAMATAGQTRIGQRTVAPTADARILAEQKSRDELFAQANTPKRADVESIPVEHTQIGDTFTMNGRPMTVVEHPVDADTGKPFGVTLDGAYGRQTILTGEKIHMDGGTLKEQPEFIGMGGAVPGEFNNTAAMPTGIKVAAIDAQRAARGLEPLTKSATRSFGGEVWPQTLARIDDNANAPQELVNQIKAKQEAGQPHALTDHDVALLMYHEADLTYQRAKLSRDMATAEDDAKQFPQRGDDLPAMRLERARIADELDKLEQVIGPARSDTGRGLAALRNMVGDNYTLAAMEFSRKAAKGGELTSAEHAELVTLRAKIEQANADLEKAKEAEAEERSKRMADEEIAARIEQVKKTPGYDRQVVSLADRIVTALEREAVLARARLKEKFSRLNAGLDPTLITDLATVGAAHIARGTLDFTRWSKAMVDDFGENVVPWLNSAWTKANERVNTAVDRLASGKQSIAVKKRLRKDDVTGQRQNIITGLKNAATDKRPLDEQGDYIRRLMENYIASGLKEREPLVDAIHKTLTEEIGLPDVSRRDVREAMSNYGKFKALNPDEIKAKRRDLSHQIAQTLKLEDITGKKPLPKSGVEQHTPSTEGRLLQQQVNEAKRRYGVVVTDPSKQLKGVLEARKTSLKNRIADLEFQIAAGERSVKTKTPTNWDAETKLLEVRRDALKKQLDDIAPKPGLTDAQRLAVSERSIERENQLLEEQIKSGEVTLRSSKPAMSSARLDALKARRTALLAEREELRAEDPQYQQSLQQRAMKSYISRLASNAADLADRTARSDFAPRQAREASWKSSPEVMKAIADRDNAKLEFKRGNELARQSQRNTFEKGMDGLSKWKRTFVLTWPSVLFKLSSAATEGVALLPLEEAAGTPFAKMFKGISEKAPRHGGGFNVQAEVKAITDTVTHLVRNVKDAASTGRTQVDILYGKPVLLPRELKDWVANLHYALKTPLMQNEFSRSFSKLMQAEAARNVDVTEPLVMQRIGNQAYELANKAIFKENNLVVNMYRRALNATRDQVDGKQTRTGKIAETALRFTFPVVDIPTTIVKRTFEYMLGAPLGLGRAAWAYRQGLENLKPDEAEAIMRNLKRGSLGGAVFLLGFFNAQNIGGYYAPGVKRDPNDVKAGGLRIFGHEVPRYLIHNPLLEQLQIGATMRRVADSHLHKAGAPQGIGGGAWAALLGLVNEVPFLGGVQHLVDNPTPRTVIGEQLKSMIPGVVQSLANRMDRGNNGETISRQPSSVWQTIETGIPGLRKNVPARVTSDIAPAVNAAMKASKLPKGMPLDQRAMMKARLAEMFKTNAPAK